MGRNVLLPPGIIYRDICRVGFYPSRGKFDAAKLLLVNYLQIVCPFVSIYHDFFLNILFSLNRIALAYLLMSMSRKNKKSYVFVTPKS